MTKEQILKHGEVIKWFVDNPNEQVWVDKSDGNGWQLYHNPSFSIEHKCVQNDKYSELRKAEADGKTIQFKPICGGKEYAWQDITKISSRINFTQDISVYRIKQEEPKFKVGDWFTHYGITHRVRSVFGDSYRAEDGYDYKEDIEPWIPTEGEWCVFWDNGDTNYIVVRYGRTLDGWNYSSDEMISTRKIAPLKFAMELKG